ncbi:uncharacterized protein LOC124983602 [Sciurus carolinensis]|uniref:uncharacterized protein LOC124983602 n=1 Tax=Sciurus carolinensis TaxID=30640 RepID=UPI001FB2C2A7|nr:uncharacterized protein LOC124983602 [Sciurus carolinensis]
MEPRASLGLENDLKAASLLHLHAPSWTDQRTRLLDILQTWDQLHNPRTLTRVTLLHSLGHPSPPWHPGRCPHSSSCVHHVYCSGPRGHEPQLSVARFPVSSLLPPKGGPTWKAHLPPGSSWCGHPPAAWRLAHRVQCLHQSQSRLQWALVPANPWGDTPQPHSQWLHKGAWASAATKWWTAGVQEGDSGKPSRCHRRRRLPSNPGWPRDGRLHRLSSRSVGNRGPSLFCKERVAARSGGQEAGRGGLAAGRVPGVEGRARLASSPASWEAGTPARPHSCAADRGPKAALRAL